MSILTKNVKTTVGLEQNLQRCGFVCYKIDNRTIIAIRKGFAYKFDVMVGNGSFDLSQIPNRLYMDSWFYAENGEVLSAFIVDGEWYILEQKELVELSRTRHHIGRPTLEKKAVNLEEWLRWA